MTSACHVSKLAKTTIAKLQKREAKVGLQTAGKMSHSIATGSSSGCIREEDVRKVTFFSWTTRRLLWQRLWVTVCCKEQRIAVGML